MLMHHHTSHPPTRRAKAAASAKPTGPPAIVFAYGSQTGTSMEIARNMHAEALGKGLHAEVRCVL